MQAFMRPQVEQLVSYKIVNPLHSGWRPAHQVVNGEVYVIIDKCDTDFFKFCTGQHIRFGQRRDPQCHYFEFYNALIKLRNSGSQDAFRSAIQEIRDAADEGEAPRKCQKIRSAKMTDVGIAGETINVKMEFAGHEQTSKMLYGCRGASMWVRADPDTLGFIQHAMHSNFVANVPNPRKNGQQQADDEVEQGGDGEDDE